MSLIKKEIEKFNADDALPAIDWSKIKEVVCNAEISIKAIADAMPAGIIQNLLKGIVSVLSLICSHL